MNWNNRVFGVGNGQSTGAGTVNEYSVETIRNQLATGILKLNEAPTLIMAYRDNGLMSAADANTLLTEISNATHAPGGTILGIPTNTALLIGGGLALLWWMNRRR